MERLEDKASVDQVVLDLPHELAKNSVVLVLALSVVESGRLETELLSGSVEEGLGTLILCGCGGLDARD